MAGFGGLGGFGSGLGGPEFPDILTALGTALLSSPRDAPFANLPSTLQLATQQGRQRQSDAAMAGVAQKLGIDPSLAANPQALALLIGQQNLQKQLDVGADLNKTIGGAFGLGAPAAPSGPTAPTGPRAPSMTMGATGGRTMSLPVDPALVPAVVKHATAAGLDPTDVLTAMSYETGGTLNPWQAGPTTQWGQHRGLIQWGQPQARQYGVGPNTSTEDQVKASIQYLKDRGVTSGMGLMDIYSAINAGSVGRYDASDANNGGAPGTVADKVNNQMAGHRARAQALLAAHNQANGLAVGDMSSAPAGQPGDSAGLPTTPYKVAGKIPVPIPADATKPLAQTGYAPETTTMKELARQKQARALQVIAGSAAMGAMGKPYADIGRLMFEDAAKYLAPTETERLVTAAFPNDPARQQEMLQAAADKRSERIKEAEYAARGSATDPPAMRRAREFVERGLPDNSPAEVKLGRAQQDTPGIVASGMEAGAAKTQAETEARARGEFAKAATQSAEAADTLQEAIKRARGHMENVVKLGGYGPWAAGVVGRSVDQAVGSLGPGGAPQREAEVERQHFDSAMATVRNAVTAARARSGGDRQVSNLDRVLLAADLPTLTSSDPKVAREAFDHLQADIDRAKALDDKFGIYRGQQRSAGEGGWTDYGDGVRARRAR